MPENRRLDKIPWKTALSYSFRVAFSPFSLKKSLPTAGVVGTFLNTINQFPHLLHHQPLVWTKVCLNYLVPFLVSSWSILSVRLGDLRQEPAKECPDDEDEGGVASREREAD